MTEWNVIGVDGQTRIGQMLTASGDYFSAVLLAFHRYGRECVGYIERAEPTPLGPPGASPASTSWR